MAQFFSVFVFGRFLRSNSETFPSGCPVDGTSNGWKAKTNGLKEAGGASNVDAGILVKWVMGTSVMSLSAEF